MKAFGLLLLFSASYWCPCRSFATLHYRYGHSNSNNNNNNDESAIKSGVSLNCTTYKFALVRNSDDKDHRTIRDAIQAYKKQSSETRSLLLRLLYFRDRCLKELQHSLGPILLQASLFGTDNNGSIIRTFKKTASAVVQVRVLVPVYKVYNITRIPSASKRKRLPWSWSQKNTEDEYEEVEHYPYYTTEDPRNKTRVNANEIEPRVEMLGYTQTSHGSGVFFNETNSTFFVVTNYHVVDEEIEGHILLVGFPGSRLNFAAEIVGFDAERDIAVIKAALDEHTSSFPGLPRPILFGRSCHLQAGQTCLGIVYSSGKPYITKGVIGATDDHSTLGGDRWIPGCIASDVRIGPGDSGCPLLNTKGELIGLQTASNDKISYAVPVDTVRRSVQQILQYGEAFTPRVGVIINDDAMLCGVVEDSSAASMGLGAFVGPKTQVISRIVKADGKAIRARGDLESLLDSKGLGSTVHLTIRVTAKQGKEANSRLLTVPLTVGIRRYHCLSSNIFGLWDC